MTLYIHIEKVNLCEIVSEIRRSSLWYSARSVVFCELVNYWTPNTVVNWLWRIYARTCTHIYTCSLVFNRSIFKKYHFPQSKCDKKISALDIDFSTRSLTYPTDFLVYFLKIIFVFTLSEILSIATIIRDRQRAWSARSTRNAVHADQSLRTDWPDTSSSWCLYRGRQRKRKSDARTPTNVPMAKLIRIYVIYTKSISRGGGGGRYRSLKTDICSIWSIR